MKEWFVLYVNVETFLKDERLTRLSFFSAIENMHLKSNKFSENGVPRLVFARHGMPFSFLSDWENWRKS